MAVLSSLPGHLACGSNSQRQANGPERDASASSA